MRAHIQLKHLPSKAPAVAPRPAVKAPKLPTKLEITNATKAANGHAAMADEHTKKAKEAADAGGADLAASHTAQAKAHREASAAAAKVVASAPKKA